MHAIYDYSDHLDVDACFRRFDFHFKTHDSVMGQKKLATRMNNPIINDMSQI